MITVNQIRDGKGYLKNHLSANDYFSENEKVVGHWVGKAARGLGLEGKEVTPEAFEALRSNRHPETGEKLRPRSSIVKFHDFVISAPKSVSIAAMVGKDERLIEAYTRCALRAFERLERFAGVRVRAGEAYRSEDLRLTRNTVAAAFLHDSSRLLDPQLHVHFVVANLTWDDTSGRWLALQPKIMAEKSHEFIRRQFYHELSQACETLGYSTESDGEAFRLSGVERQLEKIFSQRTLQREAFERRFEELFGHVPDKKRVEQFIKERKNAAIRRFEAEFRDAFGVAPTKETITRFVVDWRSEKMTTATRREVKVIQAGRMTAEQAVSLEELVSSARVLAESCGQETGVVDELGSCGSSDDREFAVVDGDYLVDKAGPSRKRGEGRELGYGRSERVVGAILRGHPAAFMVRKVLRLSQRPHNARRRMSQ